MAVMDLGQLSLGTIKYQVQLVPLSGDSSPVVVGELHIDVDTGTTIPQFASELADRFAEVFERFGKS